MINDYIFLQVQPGSSSIVARKALKVKGVKMAHAVLGAFDVIAYIEVDDLKALRTLLDKIQAFEEVERTQTAMCVPAGHTYIRGITYGV